MQPSGQTARRNLRIRTAFSIALKQSDGTNPEDDSAEMLKVELHSHTADDPIDAIPYTTVELIDHAATLGYDALAITLHEHQLDLRRFAPYAEERGVVLIPGVERTIEGRHVLLLNYASGTEDVRTFADLARLRSRAPGLVVAPHPFFPATVCLRGDLERHADLFDAVERNAMFIRGVDFNRAAERFAARHGKPVVGNCDVHRLTQLGSTYSLVDAERDPAAICEAIAAGRVRVESRPLSCVEAARVMSSMIFGRSLENDLDRRVGAVDVDDRRVLETH
jgi:predicted metal-dependent phosphoesterase TrpH